MSALFTLRVAVPGLLDPPGSTAGREGPAPTHVAGDARSSRRPDDDDDDRVDDEGGAGVPRWETLEFRAGNPRAEVITGRLRLYRDAVCASVASASSSSSAATTTTMVTNAPASLPEGRSPMVCVLAVPIELSVADFCQFAAALIPKVTEMRMVQGAPREIRTGGREDDTREVPTGKPKGRRKAEDASGETSSSSSSTTTGQSYAVILSFEDQDSADAFALNYHNRRFSSLVEGECRALFVRAIELEGESKDADPSEPSSSTTPSTSSLNELPSCPVCLDRLDQDVSGCLVTTVCSHSFHASCLSRWGDSSCPVSLF
jgi:BRCA1-associated protein